MNVSSTPQDLEVGIHCLEQPEGPMTETQEIISPSEVIEQASLNTAKNKTVCFLDMICNNSGSSNIIQFKAETLKRCQQVSDVRKKNNLKYADCPVPENLDGSQGFHNDCYKKYTALPKSHRHKIVLTSKKNEEIAETSRNVRSNVNVISPKPKQRTGVFAAVCLFCNKARKKSNGQEQKLISVETVSFANSIMQNAEQKNDIEMMTKIGNTDLVAKEAKYHACCRTKYHSEARALNKDTFFMCEKNIHKDAFQSLITFIEERIIEKKEVHLLSDLTARYAALIRDIGGDDFRNATPSSQRLEEKMSREFKERITVIKGKSRRGNLVCSSQISQEEALSRRHDELIDMEIKIREVALLLREAIKDAPKRTLPVNLTVDDLYKGEVDTPDILTQFFKYLIGGPDSRTWKQASKKRRIDCISQDVVFSASSGLKKPSKHLLTALALKSITGSRKVIEMMNRMGHCVSYHVTEELETELTYATKVNNSILPYGMVLSPICATGAVWDNFDRFVETHSGKDTLHDTVGIVYQITNESVVLPNPRNEQPNFDASDQGRGQKRRRMYEASGLDIEPYYKKPKIDKVNFLPFDDARRVKFENFVKLENWKNDVIWMMDVSLNIETPMWVGWNSRLMSSDTQSVMKIWYLPQINASPTSNAVVVETMKRSMLIAHESGKESIAVTYDLAIAKVAMQIQAMEAPKYDNIFVALGSFHVEMALFSAIGKMIGDSGGPHLLNESGVLAVGSLNGFLKGKNYKRSKRMHELLALAFEILHFKSFLSTLENAEEVKNLLTQELININAKKDIQSHEYSKEAAAILTQYKSYCQATSSGQHGKTAQFWYSYISTIHLYHEYSRSVRCGDLDSYIASLQKIANYFFALNHPNYARWLVKYHDNLLKLEVTHPEVYAEFQKGLFSIRRTKKAFSGNPIDLTLEQTINNDAASQRTGIASLTNSIGARQRWADSHFIRSSIISHVYSQLGIQKKEDVTAGLKKHNIKKDNNALQMVTDMIVDSMNPFQEELDKNHLFNIATGKAAPKNVEKFLLNMIESGKEARNKFTAECLEDNSRFEKKITRKKLDTFATVGNKKIKDSSGKVVAATIVRDLFGSILYCSLKQKIDMAHVLTYPLTPVPLSLSHVDGTPLKTPKAALMSYLESKVTSTPPPTVDVYVIDASFFLHLQSNTTLPHTFGGIAKQLLRRMMSLNGYEVHFVVDKWLSPSIKDSERDLREGSAEMYQITGPTQKRPSNWLDALKNAGFKKSLINFLVTEWQSQDLENIYGQKVLIANSGDVCYKFEVVDGQVIRYEAQDLFCNHEEADSRMFYHLTAVPENKHVVMRTNDTDCLIIALGCCQFLKSNSLRLWIEAGLNSNNSLRYVNVNQLAENLGSSLCASLIAYHAFTGCDYTASFSRRGKVRPMKLLEKEEDAQNAFIKLATKDEISTETREQIESFVCKMYGQKDLTSVNDARLQIFLERYKPKGKDEKISSLKKLDGSALPPCSRVLSEKIKRTHLVSRRWFSSINKEQATNSPTLNGWREEEGYYRILWVEGEICPTTIEVTTTDDETGININETSSESEEEDSEVEEEEEDFDNSESDSDDSIDEDGN